MKGFLTGAISAPPENITDPANPQKLISNPRYESWRRSDRLIKGWITGMLSENVVGLVVGLNSSQEIWSTLINAFAQESQERGFHLTHMLTTCKKGDDTLDVYVDKFKAICDDLAAIGKAVGDQEKPFGFSKAWEKATSLLLWLCSSHRYKELVSLLQSLEVRNKFLNSNVSPQVAFYAQHEGQTRSREMQVFGISEGLRFAEECRDQEEKARMALDFKAKSVLIMVFATAALLFLPLMLPPLPPPPSVLLLVPVAILATLIFLSLSPGGRLEKEILYACLTR
ncbi:hypothetical protein EJ110_NYTH12739 [Nymphaea thermarum]|nr:hypothetical protein EJ110_NYTH12739 [Nymphaea thermarum]